MTVTTQCGSRVPFLFPSQATLHLVRELPLSGESKHYVSISVVTNHHQIMTPRKRLHVAWSCRHYNNVQYLCTYYCLFYLQKRVRPDGQPSSQPQVPGCGCENKDFGANESMWLEEKHISWSVSAGRGDWDGSAEE